MDQLPVDVLIDILSRLPVKTLMICRCVSKPWLNITHDPRFTHAHLSRSSSQITIPNLVLKGGPNTNAYLFFLEPDQTHDSLTLTKSHFSFPDFKQFRVVGSCYGLLCLVHHLFGYVICVCNPCTGEYVKIPDPISPSLCEEMVMGFGFSPVTHEYKVVQIVRNSVFVFTLGDGSWREKEDVGYEIERIGASNVLVNGALHWVCLSHVDVIVSFDVVDEVFGVVPCPEFGEEEGCGYSLGVLSGCLSITDSSFDDRVEIWVMGDYGVKGSWTKRFVLKFSQVGWGISSCQTLGFQRDGKLLILVCKQVLLVYDPQTVRMKMLKIYGLPSWFEAVTHVASLVSPSRCLPRDRQLRNAAGNAIKCNLLSCFICTCHFLSY